MLPDRMGLMQTFRSSLLEAHGQALCANNLVEVASAADIAHPRASGQPMIC